MSINTSSWVSFVSKGEATKQYDVKCASFGAVGPKGLIDLTAKEVGSSSKAQEKPDTSKQAGNKYGMIQQHTHPTDIQPSDPTLGVVDITRVMFHWEDLRKNCKDDIPFTQYGHQTLIINK